MTVFGWDDVLCPTTHAKLERKKRATQPLGVSSSKQDRKEVRQRGREERWARYDLIEKTEDTQQHQYVGRVLRHKKPNILGNKNKHGFLQMYPRGRTTTRDSATISHPALLRPTCGMPSSCVLGFLFHLASSIVRLPLLASPQRPTTKTTTLWRKIALLIEYESSAT